MSFNDPDTILKNLEKYSKEYQHLKLVPQAHARAILINKSPSADWPKFRSDLDQRLYYMSHYYISESIKLLNFKEYQETAKIYLKEAGESLEFLSKSPNIDKSFKDEILFSSILTYYISGNYPFSYVLTKENINKLDIPDYMDLIFTLLNKDLNKARTISLKGLNDIKYDEERIINELENGEIEEIDAICRILSHSIFKVSNYLLNFIKSGESDYIEKSILAMDNSIKLAREYNLVDYWWLLKSLNFLIKEHNENSIWNQLKSFKIENNSKIILNRYITNFLDYKEPIIELWPSQVKAIPFINKKERDNFCLKMPTSSGKTRIAELTILRQYLDSLPIINKYVYIAPFRSLAVEIEKTLKKSLGSLGFKISEIYGGFELNPSEKDLIEETDILVVTPEKFDAIIRYIPEIKDQIKVIIIDEGHIIDAGNRGLNFEFFIQRIKNIFKDSRFLFISAVLPNIEEFAQWVADSPNNKVESEWRPSRLMLGEISWDGNIARIDYTDTPDSEFDQSCFIPHFIEQIETRGKEGFGRRRNPFPINKNEVIALSALKFVHDGPTLIFSPKKNETVALGNIMIKIIRFYQADQKSKGEKFDLKPNLNSKKIQKLRDIIVKEMGENADLINFLENGFLIHHGDLPNEVRIGIEDVIRSNEIKLIIATTTLAQGVNLPIKTVLIKGLQIGYDDNNYKPILLDSPSFWNICGRAGRAGKESEGQILFFIDKTDKTKEEILEIKKIHYSLIKDRNTEGIISGILKLLNNLIVSWQEKYLTTNLFELCEYLLNNDNEWIPEKSEVEIVSSLDRLDALLLAISEENENENILPINELLDEILKNSLLLIQLKQEEDKKLAKELLTARLTFVRTKYPSEVRKRIYKLGLRISDCDIIESNKEYLYDLFNQGIYWKYISKNARIEILLKISAFIFDLEGITEDTHIPTEWADIIYLWVNGFNTTKMIQYTLIRTFTDDPSKLRLFIEKSCGYILPWGINSILNYLQTYKNQRLPLICSYYSGMIKYGVNDPITVSLMPYMDNNRELAIIATKYCPYDIEDIQDIVVWIKNLDLEELIGKGLEKSIAKKIIDSKKLNSLSDLDEVKSIKFVSYDEISEKVEIGESVLLSKLINLKDTEIFKLDGKFVGKFWCEHIIPEEIFSLSSNSKIVEIRDLNKKIFITIEFSH